MTAARSASWCSPPVLCPVQSQGVVSSCSAAYETVYTTAGSYQGPAARHVSALALCTAAWQDLSQMSVCMH